MAPCEKGDMKGKINHLLPKRKNKTLCDETPKVNVQNRGQFSTNNFIIFTCSNIEMYKNNANTIKNIQLCTELNNVLFFPGDADIWPTDRLWAGAGVI